MRVKSEPEGEQYGGVHKREESNWGNRTETEGFNCSWEQVSEWVGVCPQTHML